MTYQVFCNSRGWGELTPTWRFRSGFREEAVKDGQDWGQLKWRRKERCDGWASLLPIPSFCPYPIQANLSHVTTFLLRTCQSLIEEGQRQLEIKSRMLNLEGDQRWLAPCTPIFPILFSNQILIPVFLASQIQISSSQSSNRESLSVDGTISVPSD